MRIYYAHSMRIYGTPREQEELALIKNKWRDAEVVNPNGDLVWEGDMEPYYEMVRSVDYVVCSEYKEHIGKGVFSELQIAFENKIPAFVIRNGTLQRVADVVEDNMDDWAVEYGVLIV